MVPGVYEDFGRPGAHTVALYNEFSHNMVSQQRSRLCEGPMAMSAGAAEEYLKMTWHRRAVSGKYMRPSTRTSLDAGTLSMEMIVYIE